MLEHMRTRIGAVRGSSRPGYTCRSVSRRRSVERYLGHRPVAGIVGFPWRDRSLVGISTRRDVRIACNHDDSALGPDGVDAPR
jgi:hypothetical protein